MGLSSPPQIKPLLSKKVEQPANSQFDIMKYEVSKPYVSPVQINTEYQNAEEVKSEFFNDEEVAAELGPDYNPPCSQLTYQADIRNAKERILERRRKKSIQRVLKNFVYINSLSIMFINIYFIVLTCAYERDMQTHAFLAMCDSYHKQKKQCLAVEGKDIKPDVE